MCLSQYYQVNNYVSKFKKQTEKVCAFKRLTKLHILDICSHLSDFDTLFCEHIKLFFVSSFKLIYLLLCISILHKYAYELIAKYNTNISWWLIWGVAGIDGVMLPSDG